VYIIWLTQIPSVRSLTLQIRKYEASNSTVILTCLRDEMVKTDQHTHMHGAYDGTACRVVACCMAKQCQCSTASACHIWDGWTILSNQCNRWATTNACSSNLVVFAAKHQIPQSCHSRECQITSQVATTQN
jgi:hypothetical protein